MINVGDIMSTVGVFSTVCVILSTVVDILSTMGDVQYHGGGGYHDACWDIMSTMGGYMSTMG